VSDREGLRYLSGSCLGGGDRPRATGAQRVRPRAAITAQAKPERPHACVADPSRIDGAGSGPDQGSAPIRGVAQGFESGQIGIDRMLIRASILGATYCGIRLERV
jgi:hypothetical protein